MRGGGRVGSRGIGMFRGRGFPQGRSRAGLTAGGRGGRTIGAPACWTCGSTAHFQQTVQEICKLVEVDVDRGIVDSEEVVRQLVVGLEFVLQVFLLFGMNLARRFTSLMRANYFLISKKINRMNRLSRKARKTYEALSVVQLGQDNAKKYVIRPLATLGW